MVNFNEIGFVLLHLLGIFQPVFLLTVVQFLVEGHQGRIYGGVEGGLTPPFQKKKGRKTEKFPLPNWQ